MRARDRNSIRRFADKAFERDFDDARKAGGIEREGDLAVDPLAEHALKKHSAKSLSLRRSYSRPVPLHPSHAKPFRSVLLEDLPG